MRIEVYHDPGSHSRCVRVMRRDYRHRGGAMLSYMRPQVHLPDTDKPLPGVHGLEVQELVEHLMQQAGIRDGDEFEIAVTPTGRRPHGDRYYVEDGHGSFRPETDEECLERIESNAGECVRGGNDGQG